MGVVYWWCYPTVSERWGSGGTLRRSSSRIRPCLKVLIRNQIEIVPKMACWRGSDAVKSRRWATFCMTAGARQICERDFVFSCGNACVIAWQRQEINWEIWRKGVLPIHCLGCLPLFRLPGTFAIYSILLYIHFPEKWCHFIFPKQILCLKVKVSFRARVRVNFRFRVSVRVRVEVRIKFSRNTFKYIFDQTSIRASALNPYFIEIFCCFDFQ